MMEDIITLIIHEASAEQNREIGSALKSVMTNITKIIDTKIGDLARVDNMELPDDEKDRIRNVILQAL